MRRDVRMRRQPMPSFPVRWSRGLIIWTPRISIPVTRRAWAPRLSAWGCVTGCCWRPSCRMLRASARRISTGSSMSNCGACGPTISTITSCITLPRPPSGNVWWRWALRTGSLVKRRLGAFARSVFRTTAARRTSSRCSMRMSGTFARSSTITLESDIRREQRGSWPPPSEALRCL